MGEPGPGRAQMCDRGRKGKKDSKERGRIRKEMVIERTLIDPAVTETMPE